MMSMVRKLLTVLHNFYEMLSHIVFCYLAYFSDSLNIPRVQQIDTKPLVIYFKYYHEHRHLSSYSALQYNSRDTLNLIKLIVYRIACGKSVE